MTIEAIPKTGNRVPRKGQGGPGGAIQVERPMLLSAILWITLLVGCSKEPPQEYSLGSFNGVCREKGMGMIAGYPRDSAISLAGRYARLASENGAFPGQDAECRLFRVLEPVCVQPSTFSPDFVVVGFSEAAYRNPGFLDLRFSNGSMVRFCFNRLVYRLAGDSTDDGGCANDFQGLEGWIAARKTRCEQAPGK
ncbi:MAG: hypothetical protein IPK50_16430 [Fibrobacterota bacterium]|nr:hypothetical protein [Fibrobacterota bacterium]QQS03868.1 MAG: hypothetical protein IPK50_16430 [Fibrobacterota bacterium]